MNTLLSRSIATLLALGLLVAASGCARRYIITTISGAKIITASRPKLVESKYVYKDASGKLIEISTLRVRVIEPYSKESAGAQMKRPELQ